MSKIVVLPVVNAPRLTTCPAQRDGDQLYECGLDAGHRLKHVAFGRDGDHVVNEWGNVCLYCSTPISFTSAVYIGEAEAPLAHARCWRIVNIPTVSIPPTVADIGAFAERANAYAETAATLDSQVGGDHHVHKSAVLKSLFEYLKICCDHVRAGAA